MTERESQYPFEKKWIIFKKFKFIELLIYFITQIQWIQEQSRQNDLPGLQLFYDPRLRVELFYSIAAKKLRPSAS